jgi:hypothetical protein
MTVSFTDVMLRVASLSAAVQALEQALNLSPVESGEGWVALSNAGGTNRIVLTTGDFGSSWALGCLSDKMGNPNDQFRGWNSAGLSSISEKGYALLTHEAGLFAVVYE